MNNKLLLGDREVHSGTTDEAKQTGLMTSFCESNALNSSNTSNDCLAEVKHFSINQSMSTQIHKMSLKQ